jgi:hypothetical protein
MRSAIAAVSAVRRASLRDIENLLGKWAVAAGGIERQRPVLN